MVDDLDWVCACDQAPCPGCVCTRDEMALHRYAAAAPATPARDGVPPRPMTAAERDWCVAAAARGGAGRYTVAELTARSDASLARAVLRTWQG